MRCASVYSKLSAYVDGELSVRQYRKVEQHLEHCHGCQTELKKLKGVNRMLHMVEAPSPLPERFWLELRGKCLNLQPKEEESMAMPGVPRWRWTWAAVPMGLAACVCLVVFLVAPSSKTDEQPSRVALETTVSPLLSPPMPVQPPWGTGTRLNAAEEILLLHSAKDASGGMAAMGAGYWHGSESNAGVNSGVVPVSADSFVVTGGR